MPIASVDSVKMWCRQLQRFAWLVSSVKDFMLK